MSSLSATLLNVSALENGKRYLVFNSAFNTSDQGSDLYVVPDPANQPPMSYDDTTRYLNLGKLQKFNIKRVYDSMKKRTFLLSGTAIAGTIILFRYPLWRSPKMRVENSKFEITKSEEEWRKILTPEQFQVLRKHGTERAGTSLLNQQYAKGIYLCAACDLPLFTSETKFNSETGWPSFYTSIKNAIETTTDRSLFVARTEVHCRRCGGHLGHLFEDGPKPTGQRYCMNGAAMKFILS